MLVVAGAMLAPSGAVLAADSAAEGAVRSAGDCTQIDLRFQTLDAPLTDAEIAELRARRHAESLNAFERCITQASRAAGNGSGTGSGGGNSTAGVAASGISGTNPTASATNTPPTEAPPEIEVASETTESQQPPQQANGRAPEDIPPADNDSILAAQIRQAAETETDPERQRRLWNEYRKIKGLPTKGS